MPRIWELEFGDMIKEALLMRKAMSEIYHATVSGDFRTVRKMIRNGVDLNVQETVLGITPLFGAVMTKNVAMIKELVRSGADPNFVAAKRQTPLLIAISTGDLNVVKALLDNGANLNAKYEKHDSMLHIAVAVGTMEICRHLIERGLDVNVKNSLGSTPLHYTVRKTDEKEKKCRKQQVDKVKLLLGKGANVNVGACNLAKKGEADFKIGGNFTPLFLAAAESNAIVVELLIKAGADVNVKTTGEYTPLHPAVTVGHFGIVKMLLRAGSDVNAQTNEGKTPLYIAAQYGDTDIVEALLEVKGIDINLSMKEGATPLSIAAGNGHFDIVKLLVAKGASIRGQPHDMVRPLHVALMGEKEDTAQFLIENGADIHVVDVFDYAPLHYACENGMMGTVKALIEKSADVSVRNGETLTALHLAAKKDHAEVVKYLIDKGGADPNATDEDNQTALHHAAISGSAKAVEVLVTRAKIDPFSSSFLTPLHIATDKGHREIVQILLKNGANVNTPGESNRTALHIAAKEGKFGIAKLLLKCNAAINVRETEHGDTPLLSAVLGQHEKLVNLLIEYGADINAANHFGALPIHVAAHVANIEIIKTLLSNGSYYNLEARERLCCKGVLTRLACTTEKKELATLIELVKELFDAVIKNDTQKIKCCVEAGTILNARDVSGSKVHSTRSGQHANARVNNVWEPLEYMGCPILCPTESAIYDARKGSQTSSF